MAGYGAAFSRGMMIGAGAALVYAAAKETASFARGERPRLNPDTPRRHLIDWQWAESVAVRTAGQAPTLHPSAAAQLKREYQALLREIEQPIAAYTGNSLSLANTDVQVLDRPGWIRANMALFRDLLAPVEDFYREMAEAHSSRPGVLPSAAMQRSTALVASAQMGILVGYLSRRVLGQYDMSVLGAEPLIAGKLYFVEPNLRSVETALAVPRDELRRWVALHEATHAHEFELHPWVREYMNTTMRNYLRLLIADMRKQTGEHALLTLANRLLENMQRGQNMLFALMTPEQRELVSRLQALMSLAEGYSNHVMNAVGRDLLPNFDLIHARVEHRQRRRSGIETAFLKITGLSLKMEQYRRGEQFVDTVVRERGIAFANRAWDSPECLPTEAEIREPQRWVGRMERAVS